MPPPIRVSHRVFSAYAEVVPSFGGECVGVVGILRVRGGSSHSEVDGQPDKPYSPRTRR